MNARLRNAARRAANAVGLAGPAKRAYHALDPGMRRDKRDNEHLALLLAFTLSPDSNCIEVGAHTGDVLREMVRLAPQGKHIAYEPLPQLAAELRREFPDVDVRQAALSTQNGQTTFTHVLTDPGFSGFRERDYHGEQQTETITVRTETLDSSLPEGFVPALIKVDVEGAEQQVFEGAIETITRHKPVIWFEHGKGGASHYGTRPRDIYDLLVTRAGLRLFDADGNGPYSQAEFDQVFERPIWNFVARA